jgi:hypothetical protein
MDKIWFGIVIGFVVSSLGYIVVLMLELKVEMLFLDRRLTANKRSLVRLDKEMKELEIERRILNKLTSKHEENI